VSELAVACVAEESDFVEVGSSCSAVGRVACDRTKGSGTIPVSRAAVSANAMFRAVEAT